MVVILMSTYNGEKYIREQINSILSQTYHDWILYIRDDGSTDDTLSIIRSYIDVYPDKIFLYKNSLGNLGFARSFMFLLENIKADYYMFCDQDDVWFSTKIDRSLSKMREQEDLHKNESICVFTDLCVTDEKLNVVSESMFKLLKRDPYKCNNIYYLANSWLFSGNTLLFNKSCRDKVVIGYNSEFSHDLWISLVNAKYGINVYLNEATIYYRQHSFNLHGALKWKRNFRNNLMRLFVSPIRIIRDNFLLCRKYNLLPYNICCVKFFLYKFLVVLKEM